MNKTKSETAVVTISFACPMSGANELADCLLKTIQEASPRHVLESEVRPIKNSEWAEVKDTFDYSQE